MYLHVYMRMLDFFVSAILVSKTWGGGKGAAPLGPALCSHATSQMMLRVWRPSGQELAAIPLSELSSVDKLKKLLHQRAGVPKFRQNLVHGSEILEDHTRLASLEPPLDLQLVVLPFVTRTFSGTPLFSSFHV